MKGLLYCQPPTPQSAFCHTKILSLMGSSVLVTGSISQIWGRFKKKTKKKTFSSCVVQFFSGTFCQVTICSSTYCRAQVFPPTTTRGWSPSRKRSSRFDLSSWDDYVPWTSAFCEMGTTGEQERTVIMYCKHRLPPIVLARHQKDSPAPFTLMIKVESL